MQNNQFTIAGGKSGLQVSWLVIGERQDAAAKHDPLQVEISKDDPSLAPQSPDHFSALHAC